ncbi:putative ATP-dependent RNA helicase [Colletotrichum spaethianum]|uniref:ATP-dependent RNA helicase n=1 Tax=Colletotrichum spaethianum TaxID=700344 RepID=A0AA37P5W7_9PEZI|nr:putative ATP-dependent RNA helicase [Colletotrichum spaethianum]GKT44856.1 putative ATP-dependent RNA helicase [Colletotrichum spaethianum]
MSSNIRSLLYHGHSQKSVHTELDQYDIVITTYNVVASEWRTSKQGGRSLRLNLLSSKWHRVILDEAHMIRSPGTQNAKAVRALDAMHRWCITGTPLQNRTRDIFSLLQFLRVYPYDNPRSFDRDITHPCKVQVEEKGLKMLRKLMQMITLHRGRKVIDLPSLQENVEEVGMTAIELAVYEEARDGTYRYLDHALHSEGSADSSSYINAFRRVNQMRYICNHGVNRRQIRLNSSPPPGAVEDSSTNIDELDHILDNLDEACLNCGTDITDDQESFEKPEILANMGDNQQRFVMFSFWTSTLDMMQQALDSSGISSCRYQGTMKYATRTESLRRFCTERTIKVILVSISCGGQGLNLTVANHCILIEPQWNPMVEEQAVARVYRLGQEKAVSVTRFVVKGTIERKVLERQTRKKVLADLVLGKEKIKEGDDGKKQLAVSFRN